MKAARALTQQLLEQDTEENDDVVAVIADEFATPTTPIPDLFPIPNLPANSRPRPTPLAPRTPSSTALACASHVSPSQWRQNDVQLADAEDDGCDSAGTPDLPPPPLLMLLYSYRPGSASDVSGKGYSKRGMSVSRAKGVPTMMAEGEWRVRFARPGPGIDVAIGGSSGGDADGEAGGLWWEDGEPAAAGAAEGLGRDPGGGKGGEEAFASRMSRRRMMEVAGYWRMRGRVFAWAKMFVGADRRDRTAVPSNEEEWSKQGGCMRFLRPIIKRLYPLSRSVYATLNDARALLAHSQFLPHPTLPHSPHRLRDPKRRFRLNSLPSQSSHQSQSQSHPVPSIPEYPRNFGSHSRNFGSHHRNFGSLNTPTLPQITPGTSVHSTPPHPFPNSHHSPDPTLRLTAPLRVHRFDVRPQSPHDVSYWPQKAHTSTLLAPLLLVRRHRCSVPPIRPHKHLCPREHPPPHPPIPRHLHHPPPTHPRSKGLFAAFAPSWVPAQPLRSSGCCWLSILPPEPSKPSPCRSTAPTNPPASPSASPPLDPPMATSIPGPGLANLTLHSPSAIIVGTPFALDTDIPRFEYPFPDTSLALPGLYEYNNMSSGGGGRSGVPALSHPSSSASASCTSSAAPSPSHPPSLTHQHHDPHHHQHQHSQHPHQPVHIVSRHATHPIHITHIAHPHANHPISQSPPGSAFPLALTPSLTSASAKLSHSSHPHAHSHQHNPIPDQFPVLHPQPSPLSCSHAQSKWFPPKSWLVLPPWQSGSYCDHNPTCPPL
ncbi:hypothetical protein BDN71DRAFT_1513238 [Pleurotus eryngii]|uniref:Uncharacterized protein n=1 Tax=Pleurotus eryngii TaxID=5323 RepID=A0A9P5ZLY0_PLEER|nr:hypothetical protein BDN71DRAFT_1513238 [Pleurotus eryngii]